MNVRVARAGARIVEVGSTERARLNGVSNLKAIPDGLRVLHIILAERRRLNRVRMDQVVIALRLKRRKFRPRNAYSFGRHGPK